MDAEREWRAVTFCPAYEVSNDGLVRRVLPAQGTWPGRVIHSKSIKGFQYVTLHYWPTFVSVGVHNLVYAAFIGPIPPGYFVVHRDGDKGNNRAAGEEDGQVTWETPVSPRRYTGQSYGDPTTNLRRAARSRMHARCGQEEASEPWQVARKGNRSGGRRGQGSRRAA